LFHPAPFHASPAETNAKRLSAKRQQVCAASQTGLESQPTFRANKRSAGIMRVGVESQRRQD
jgi:hypothetical protein